QGITLSLTNEDLKNYIDEKVLMKILKRYIVETNQPELQRCDTVKKLVQLIHEMFKMHWQCKNVAQVHQKLVVPHMGNSHCQSEGVKAQFFISSKTKFFSNVGVVGVADHDCLEVVGKITLIIASISSLTKSLVKRPN
ncbi:2361_t:CDS:2, partial [Cetraspora pellucida]